MLSHIELPASAHVPSDREILPKCGSLPESDDTERSIACEPQHTLGGDCSGKRRCNSTRPTRRHHLQQPVLTSSMHVAAGRTDTTRTGTKSVAAPSSNATSAPVRIRGRSGGPRCGAVSAGHCITWRVVGLGELGQCRQRSKSGGDRCNRLHRSESRRGVAAAGPHSSARLRDVACTTAGQAYRHRGA